MTRRSVIDEVTPVVLPWIRKIVEELGLSCDNKIPVEKRSDIDFIANHLIRDQMVRFFFAGEAVLSLHLMKVTPEGKRNSTYFSIDTSTLPSGALCIINHVVFFATFSCNATDVNGNPYDYATPESYASRVSTTREKLAMNAKIFDLVTETNSSTTPMKLMFAEGAEAQEFLRVQHRLMVDRIVRDLGKNLNLHTRASASIDSLNIAIDPSVMKTIENDVIFTVTLATYKKFFFIKNDRNIVNVIRIG